ncbi:MAG TPA: RecX family transcriptional regulator [Ktedonobacterales bacterium]
MRITAIEPQEKRPDRYSLHLDGRYALGLDGAAVVAAGLYVGMELSEADVERLRQTEGERRLWDAALRFLAPRPRSRAEVRRRLLAPRRNREAPAAEAVDHVLDRLQEQGLLDDQQFAAFWVENRDRFSPRGSRAIAQELRQRGVSRETVEEATTPELDEERALAAGRQRLRSVASLDFAGFRAKLGPFLLRRGFSYEVAREAVRRLWDETHEGMDAVAGDEDQDEDVSGDPSGDVW